ncbi:tetraacyldisaccharide 4'-kinase [Maricurvus nonylphenolicus]|uniref:tetraacyldisaccharide 4'-kinase n=1 Tax=Maricurvus nonylphenolicus TaxID=1008307 RepID=UPI0036F3BDB5
MSQQFWSDAWYQGRWWLVLLLPLSGLFGFIARLRRRKLQGDVQAYTAPVVVVGNISLGGTGKTPLLISLVNAMRERGFRPGVVSRGYGGRASQYPYLVTVDSEPAQSGDEPLLIALEAGCPVVVDPNRDSAVKYLLDNFDCDLVLSDDGLQHYALHRDFEICVVDGQRGLGNGRCLPAGPLRESPERLSEVDWVVVNGELEQSLPLGVASECLYTMTVQPSEWRELSTGSRIVAAKALPAEFVAPLNAVSGIGNPSRFFNTLSSLGVEAGQYVFPDHHAYTEDDLAFAEQGTLLMTTKDAVKCRKFVKPNWWSLSVTAQLPDVFYDQIAESVRARAADLIASKG